MATPRAVRIPRSARPPIPATSAAAESGVRLPPDPASERTTERRVNRAATQRAFRLSTIYLAALSVLYVGFVVLDRESAGGTGPTAETGLLYFTAFAALLAVGGVLVALSSTPRAVEVSPTAMVVVEWWGHRRVFPPLPQLHVEILRRHRAGFLSNEAVLSVEIWGARRGRRTYQIEEGLVPEQRPERRAPDA